MSEQEELAHIYNQAIGAAREFNRRIFSVKGEEMSLEEHANRTIEALRAENQKLKEENETLKATITGLQIQHSKGLYTPMHEAERRALSLLVGELAGALERLEFGCYPAAGKEIASEALKKYEAWKGEKK